MHELTRADWRTTPRRIARATGAIATTAVLATVLAATAAAAPTEVTVRIEGAHQTIFEGPLLTDGHAVQAASDAVPRTCDGTNNGQSPTPGSTPTAAADDALSTLGLDFDARWYPGFDDYFITRLGPDRENPGEFWHWGILVDGAFTPVGGCQARLAAGQEVLWVYNAFQDRRFLWLDAVGGAPREDRLTVAAGTPVEFLVESSTGGMDGTAQDRRIEPGIAVAPVGIDSRHFQTPLPGHPLAAASNAHGVAALTFTEPGWHRVKASREGPAGPEAFVRSNRIAVCVVDPPAAPDCPPLPADVAVRTPPDDRGGPGGHAPKPPGGGPSDSTDRSASGGRPRLSRPWLLDGLAARGRFGLRWNVLERGAGVRSWRVDSRALGRPKGRWTRRARGSGGKVTARFRLPAGRTHALRLTAIDRRGRRVTVAAGSALAPLDDRARRLRYTGRWRKARDAGAWRRTVRTGRRGAALRVRLAAGRPTFLLRALRRPARVEVRAGRHSETFVVTGGRGAATRELIARRRARGGRVVLRVRSGAVRLDGVAARP